MNRPLHFLAFAMMVFGLAGCSGEGAGKLAVKGTVNFEGKPLPTGTIRFESADPASPLVSGAPITDGKFAIAQKQGLKPGSYVVRISSANESVKDQGQAPGISGPPAKELIPADWNVKGKQKVEVSSSATDLTFDIK